MKCLVIILDRCQPAFLGPYGNDWLATPALDRLAAASVVFDQHFAADATEEGARWNWRKGSYRGLHRRATSLTERLWQAGIPSILIGDERSPTAASPLAAGWETQQWIRRPRLGALEQESLLGGTVQTAIEWLQRNKHLDQWLLWLELGALRLPWDPAEFDAEALEGLEEAKLTPWFDPPEGRIGQEIAEADEERLAATYGGVLVGMDQWLGLLLDQLREMKLHDDTLIIATSDCGLPLGEHGVVGDYRPWLHEERVHLPLIVHLPQGAEAGRRVQKLTLSVDLYTLLLDAFGIRADEGRHSTSLLSIARGESVRSREYVISVARAGPGIEYSIRTLQWYFLLPARGRSPVETEETSAGQRGPQLYVKPEDRWEVNNVLGQYPAVAEHLELALRRALAALRTGRTEEMPELREDVLKASQG